MQKFPDSIYTPEAKAEFAGGFVFEIGDRRDGLIIARCWSRQMANRIRTLLNRENRASRIP
jgi:hypothetical protein